MMATAAAPIGSSARPTRASARPGPAPRPPDEGSAGAEQQAERAGDRRQVHVVGAVDAIEGGGWAAEQRRAARLDPQGVDPDHGRCAEDQRADDVPRQPDAHQRNEHERPDQVPLLFDREAPEVAQRRRLAREVRHVAEDLPPVVGVEDRPGDLPTDLRLLFRRSPQHGSDPDRQQHGVERWEQSTGAPLPEVAERHLAVSVALVEQQRRDEEPRHDEEHFDAEEATSHPREAGVVEQHDADRQRSQAVERWLIPHGGELVQTHGRFGGASLRCRRGRRTIDDRRHRRSDVPSRVVSTVQPSAWSSARKASARAKSLAARASSSARARASASASISTADPSVRPTAPAIS